MRQQRKNRLQRMGRNVPNGSISTQDSRVQLRLSTDRPLIVRYLIKYINLFIILFINIIFLSIESLRESQWTINVLPDDYEDYDQSPLVAKKESPDKMHSRNYSKCDSELIPSELGIRMKMKKRTRESIRRENTPKWKRKLGRVYQKVLNLL